MPHDQSSANLSTTTDYFTTTHPWTSTLLTAPETTTFIAPSRTPKSTTEDSLIAKTLSSQYTIPHTLTFHPRITPACTTLPSCTTLFALGPDLNGFPSILHGGIISTLLDEAMGILLTRNADLAHMRAVGRGEKSGEWAEEGLGLVTKSLVTRYKRPVRTPGCVAVRVEMDPVKGRERVLRGWVEQWEDDKGKGALRVCAEGEGVFVEPRRGKL